MEHHIFERISTNLSTIICIKKKPIIHIVHEDTTLCKGPRTNGENEEYCVMTCGLPTHLQHNICWARWENITNVLYNEW